MEVVAGLTTLTTSLTGTLWNITGITALAGTLWNNLPGFQRHPQFVQPNYESIVENILTNQKFLKSLQEANRGATKFDDSQLIKELKLIEENYNAKANEQLEVFKAELQGIKNKLSMLSLDQSESQSRSEEDMFTIKSRLELLSNSIKTRADDMDSKAREDNNEFSAINLKLRGLEDQLTSMESQLTNLHASVQTCCQNKTEMAEMISKIINETFSSKDNTNPMVALLAKYFVTKPELQDVFANVEDAKIRINEEVKSLLESNANLYNREKIVEELLVQLKQTNTGDLNEKPSLSGLNELEVKSIVEQALLQYDADKTGLFDYALETAGGSVVSTRCTETFVQKSGMYSIFGIPIWYPSNNPRTVIQPGVLPGECWAFKGSAGFIVIQLSEPIAPFQFSLEHISKAMSPSGRIDSAPREFAVYGLRYDKDPEPVKLGEYVYLEDGNPLQFFQVQTDTDLTFAYIELDVNSNYGNLNYTCIYRFRVHGHTGTK